MADIVIRGIEIPKEPTPLTLYPDGRWNDYTDGAKGEFLLLPGEYEKLIDVRPVVRAHWIDMKPTNEKTGLPISIKGPDFQCSNCGSIEFKRNYCPNCGAEMEENNNEN